MISRYVSVISTILLLALVGVSPIQSQTLTLEQAVDLALENSPAALIARQRVMESSARVQQSRAAFLPMVRLTSSYTLSDNPVQAFMFGLNQGEFSMAGDFNNPPTADNWQTSAQVQMRLFAGGRDWAYFRAAQAGKRGALHLEKIMRDNLTLQVVESYLAILTAGEYVRASEAAVRGLQADERAMRSHVDAGTALRTGLLEIQIQLSQAEERLLQAGNSLALARESLRFALGMDSLPFHQFSNLDEITLREPDTLEKRERPEILARAAMLEISRAELRAAKGGYLPLIMAFASLDRNQGHKFNGTDHSWSAGLMLEWPLFDGFQNRSLIREKKSRVRIAEQDERTARLQVTMEATSTRLNLENAAKRVNVMDRAVELANEHIDLARLRFQQGLMLPSEVIEAESALFQAKAGLVQAKADRLNAIAALRRALGLSIIGDTNHD